MLGLVGVCDQADTKEQDDKTVDGYLKVGEGVACNKAVVSIEQDLVFTNMDTKANKGNLTGVCDD